MSTQDIIQKLWNLCNVLRDDGIIYHQYVSELTCILFLKCRGSRAWIQFLGSSLEATSIRPSSFSRNF